LLLWRQPHVKLRCRDLPEDAGAVS